MSQLQVCFCSAVRFYRRFLFPPLDFTGMSHWTPTVRLEKLLLKMKMLLSFCTFVQSSIIFQDNLRGQNDWMNDLELNPPSNWFTSLSEMELVILTDVLHVAQTEEMYFFSEEGSSSRLNSNWIWSSDLKRKKKKPLHLISEDTITYYRYLLFLLLLVLEEEPCLSDKNQTAAATVWTPCTAV